MLMEGSALACHAERQRRISRVGQGQCRRTIYWRIADLSAPGGGSHLPLYSFMCIIAPTADVSALRLIRSRLLAYLQPIHTPIHRLKLDETPDKLQGIFIRH